VWQQLYHNICSNTLFSHYNIFHFTSYKYFQTNSHLFVFPSMQCKSFQKGCHNVFISTLLTGLFQFTLFGGVRKFLDLFLSPFCLWSPCFLSMNSSVFMLFLIGKVITATLTQHAHLIIACNIRLTLYSSQFTHFLSGVSVKDVLFCSSKNNPLPICFSKLPVFYFFIILIMHILSYIDLRNVRK